MNVAAPAVGLPAGTVALLRRRAARLRAPAVELAEGGTTFWAAEFPLGEETHAIPLEALRSALPMRLVTPVPLAPTHVIGVLRYQGQVITALSMAALLGAPACHLDPAVLLVVDPGGGALTAVDCEQIPKPVAYPRARVDEARATNLGAVLPLLLPGEPRRRVHLIEPSRLLDRPRWGGSP